SEQRSGLWHVAGANGVSETLRHPAGASVVGERDQGIPGAGRQVRKRAIYARRSAGEGILQPRIGCGLIYGLVRAICPCAVSGCVLPEIPIGERPEAFKAFDCIDEAGRKIRHGRSPRRPPRAICAQLGAMLTLESALSRD